jgi:ribosomal protein L7/L12
MPKKFFDIIPPQEKRNFPPKVFLGSQKNKEDASSFFQNRSRGEDVAKKSERFRKKIIFFRNLKLAAFCLFLLIGIGILALISGRSKIRVEIWPAMETVNLQTEIILGAETDKFNFEAKTIPAKILKDQRSASENFSSSGKMTKEEKAEGLIRVFNSYSTSAQPLLARTRFVSDKGKLFRSIKREVIPGGHYEKGKFVAGFTDIKVRAAEPGESYNIGPSTFSIPGFKGTPKYTYFYGKSFSPMSGGFKGEVPQVSEEDLKRGERLLSERLKKESRDFLKKSLPSDYILLDQAIFQRIVEENSSAKAGQEAQSFNLRIKIKSQGAAFKKSDIEKFVKKFIAANIPADKKFQEDSLKVSYIFKSPSGIEDENRDLNNVLKSKKAVLVVRIRANIYQNLNLIGLKKALAGKSLKEAKLFVEDLPYAVKVRISSWLFLKRRVPDDINKIELKLNF